LKRDLIADGATRHREHSKWRAAFGRVGTASRAMQPENWHPGHLSDGIPSESGDFRVEIRFLR
jgi:hypothetical protein